MSVDLKKFEYGFISLILAGVAGVAIAGGLGEVLTVGSYVPSITMSLTSAPTQLQSGLWLINAAGDKQRFEYNNFTDDGGGVYTFTLKRSSYVRYNFAIGELAYSEIIPVVDFGDTVNEKWDVYIEVKAGDNARNFPNVKEFWTCTVMAAVVYRTAQDKDRAKNTALYSAVEELLIWSLDAATATTATGVQVNGLLPQQMEDGLFDNERFGSVCSTEVKYSYS